MDRARGVVSRVIRIRAVPRISGIFIGNICGINLLEGLRNWIVFKALDEDKLVVLHFHAWESG